MEQVGKWIYIIWNIEVFCLAIFCLFMNDRGYSEALQSVAKLKKENVIFEQYNDEGRDIVTRAEIIDSLCTKLDYDIEIDGTLISKSGNTKLYISTYKINCNKYLKSYSYDNKGNITKIIYTGL